MVGSYWQESDKHGVFVDMHFSSTTSDRLMGCKDHASVEHWSDRAEAEAFFSAGSAV